MSTEKLKQIITVTLASTPYKNDVASVSLFGSQVTGNATPDSDIDILISFKPESKIGFFQMAQIQRALEERAGKRVDLLTPESLKDTIKETVLAQAELIYEQG